MPRPAWSGWTESCSRWAPGTMPSMASMRHKPTGGSPATRTTNAAANASTVPGPGSGPIPRGSNSVSAAASRCREQRELVGADGADESVRDPLRSTSRR